LQLKLQASICLNDLGPFDLRDLRLFTIEPKEKKINKGVKWGINFVIARVHS
jgi:hypothetical protein